MALGCYLGKRENKILYVVVRAWEYGSIDVRERVYVLLSGCSHLRLDTCGR